jgi:hypothetical protein
MLDQMITRGNSKSSVKGEDDGRNPQRDHGGLNYVLIRRNTATEKSGMLC